MVQVFSPSPAAMQGAQIGQAAGTGIAKRLGLAEAEKMANEANNDPVKLGFALARASMYAPGLDRSLGQIYEQMLARSQSNQTADALTDVTGGTPSTRLGRSVVQGGEVSPNGPLSPSMDIPLTEDQPAINITIPDKKNYDPNDIKELSNQFMLAMRPDLIQGSGTYGRVPSFNFGAQSDLRPEEEAQLRQDLRSKKYAPKAIESTVETIRNDIKTKYKELQDRYSYDKDWQNAVNEKWATFRKLSDTNLDPILGKYQARFGFGGRPATSNDLKNKYFQYAQELPVSLTPEQMHSQAAARLKNDVDRLDALAALPAMPPVRSPNEVEENVKLYKDASKDLYKEGFYESLKEDFVDNKGMGLEELHWTLWGDQTDKNSLREVGALKAPPLYNRTPTKSSGLAFVDVPNPNYVKEHEPYLKNLTQKMLKIKPDDDLVLLKAQVLNGGGLEKDFTDALDNAQEKGLKLSPFQNTQLQEVRIPRKRPLWEIFNPLTWGKWISFQAGKR